MRKIFIACFILTLTACRYVTNEGPVLIEPLTAHIDTAAVTRGNIETIELHQGITRIQSDPISFSAGGLRLGGFNVFPGDYIIIGQTLAWLDIDHIKEQIASQEASISHMRILHALEADILALNIEIMLIDYYNLNSYTYYNTATRLREDIAWARLAKSHLLQNQALDYNEAVLRLQELTASIANTELIAPFSGVVTYLTARPGDWINAYEPVIYAAKSRTVFVEYIGQSMSAGRARQSVRVQAHLYDRIFDLEIINLTQEQQDYYNRIGVSQPIRYNIITSEDIPIGASVIIFFYSLWYEDVLRVPRNALFIGPNGHYVYRIDNGQLTQVFVRTSMPTETFVAIFYGLFEGDEVFVRP